MVNAKTGHSLISSLTSLNVPKKDINPVKNASKAPKKSGDDKTIVKDKSSQPKVQETASKDSKTVQKDSQSQSKPTLTNATQSEEKIKEISKTNDKKPAIDIKTYNIISGLVSFLLQIGNMVLWRYIRAVDNKSESYIKFVRKMFVSYLAFTQAIYLLIKLIIWKTNDRTLIEIQSTLGSLPLNMANSPLGGLLSKVATKLTKSTSMTVKDYDLEQLEGMNQSLIFEVLLGSFFHLVRPKDKTILYIMGYGLSGKLRSKLFQLHILRFPSLGEHARPFNNPLSGALKALSQTAATNQEKPSDKPIVVETPVKSIPEEKVATLPAKDTKTATSTAEAAQPPKTFSQSIPKKVKQQLKKPASTSEVRSVNSSSEVKKAPSVKPAAPKPAPSPPNTFHRYNVDSEKVEIIDLDEIDNEMNLTPPPPPPSAKKATASRGVTSKVDETFDKLMQEARDALATSL